MTDDKDNRITTRRFAEYATRRGISINVCPSCGQESPKLLVHEHERTSTALGYATDSMLHTGALPLVTVECDNCGYLWLYNRRSVQEKMERDDG